MTQFQVRVIAGASTCAAIGLCLALYIAQQRSLAAARHSQFLQIASYVDSPDVIKIPPLLNSGGRLWSWRLRLASYNANIPVDELPRLREPWDSDYNLRCVDLGRPSFCRRNLTPFICAIRGADTALSVGIEQADEFPEALIMFMECESVKENWMSPVEFDLDDLRRGRGHWPGSDVSSGFLVMFSDRRVVRLSDRIPRELLVQCLTVATASQLDRRRDLSPWVVCGEL